MAQSKAALKSSAAYHKRRREAGERKITIWATAETRLDLECLKRSHGSNEAAIAAALALAAKAISR